MMNSTRLIVDSCLTFVLAVAGIAPEVHSELYVATDGKYSNPGTIERPLRTIQHAADMAKPGVTVYVRGGSYYQQLAIKVSGNAQQGFITFQSQPGEHAVLDGGCLTAPEGDTGMVELTNEFRARTASRGAQLSDPRPPQRPVGNSRIRGRFPYRNPR